MFPHDTHTAPRARFPLCLQIDELFRVIAGHAHRLPDGAATVAALGATCRAFFVPAMEVLWSGSRRFDFQAVTLSSPVWPLPDAGAERAGRRPADHLVLVLVRELLPRAPEMSDAQSRVLDREYHAHPPAVGYQMHANWIQRSTARPSGKPVHDVLHQSVWTTAASHVPALAFQSPHSPSICALPILRSSRSTRAAPFPHSLVRPGLRSVRLGLGALTGSDAVLLLKQLHAPLADVEELGIECNLNEDEDLLGVYGDKREVQCAVHELLQHMPLLRRLECSWDALSQSACETAYSAQFLETIRFVSRDGRKTWLSDLRVPGKQVHILRMRDLPVKQLVWAVTGPRQRIYPASFTSIDVELDFSPMPLASAEFERHLHAHYRILAVLLRRNGDSLETLRIRRRHNVDDDDCSLLPTSSPYVVPHLAGMDALCHLRTVDLDSAPLGLTDRCIAALARSWPRVESLRLRTVVNAQHRISLQGLVPLAVHCRALHELALNIDAQSVDEQDMAGVTNSALRRFDVRHSPAGAGRDVAMFLGALFPRLTDIVSTETDEVTDRAWAEVKERLGARKHVART